MVNCGFIDREKAIWGCSGRCNAESHETIFGSNPYMETVDELNLCQLAKHAKVISKSRGGIFKIVNLGQVQMFTGSLSNGILS